MSKNGYAVFTNDKKEIASAMVFNSIEKALREYEENGRGKWEKPWLTFASPVSFASGKPYGGQNSFVLALHQLARGLESNLWLTAKECKKQGARFSGSPVSIFSPSLPVFEKENGKIVTDANGKKVVKYYKRPIAFRVWNVSQLTEISDDMQARIDSLMPKKREVGSIDSALLALGEKYAENAELHSLKYAGDSAFYRPADDSVTMPPIEYFKSASAFGRTLFHEFAHSTGHAKRLERKAVTGSIVFGSDIYSREELTAEITALILAMKTGIDSEIAMNSLAYLASWRQELIADWQAVKTAGSEAAQAADYIMKMIA